MADLRFTKDFSRIELDSNVQGERDFFALVMQQLEDQTFAVFKVGVPMPEGAMAYFTVKKGIANISLSEGAASFHDGKVKFKDAAAFAVFMHESSHFQQECVDDGMFRHPRLFGQRVLQTECFETIRREGLSPRESIAVRDFEYEAGWRALVSAKKFGLFKGSRLLLEQQLENLVNYDIHRQDREWIDAFYGLEAERRQEYIDSAIAGVGKLSEWEDPWHKLPEVR